MEENNRDNKKRKAIDEPPTVNLKVNSQDNDELYFRIRRDSALLKLMKAYCEKKQLEFKCIRFFYDGQYIRPKQTPDSLGMEDGDEIDAMTPQSGGGWRSDC